jgi:hypothetical protein
MGLTRRKCHAFTDGLSRRDAEDVTREDDRLGLPPDELPTEWTVPHVAYRMVEAFRTLRKMPSRIGPRSGGNAWPAMLQEFADLIDEDAMANARAAFVHDRHRPKAAEIARMEEALAWPMRFGAGEPLMCDAVVVWSFCKASHCSIASFLRDRRDWAKRLADNMTIAENNRRQAELRRESGEILAWAERMAEERGLRGRTGDGYAEGRARLLAAAQARHAEAKAKHGPVTIAPHEAIANKVLSRTSLDRYLRAGLFLLRERLDENSVLIR